ncbi:hypothetical protein BN961_02176 [Afipia felis]|uniref:Uncharacterized protein n=1 Tax=Afipia felis TaxID=1035 RepID=A0A090N7K4_AFIFE|nr:hypothetical protein [Afipia felis]CEG08758.1 hypothetical protein BN961_02176 [Afipia felis]
MAEGKRHTELPWRVSGKQSIRGPNGEYVAKANWRDGIENASLIVAAVNTCPAVEGLVEALESYVEYFEYEALGDLARSSLERFHSHQNGGEA